MPPSSRGDTAEGYWGEISSTIDWCEENYVVSHYVAEFWNMVSNLMMIIPPLLCAVQGIRHGFERRLVMCHLSLLAVGLGSWCFHMTLLYSMQLLDELPMIWGSLVLLYSMTEMEKPLFTENRSLQLLLVMYCLFVTVIYLLTKNVLFFQLSYCLMVLSMMAVGCRFLWRYGWKLKLSLQFMAIGSYSFGFILWMIDNHYCSSIRVLRENIGPALGVVTQLHAWWHVCAGLGTYLGIIFTFHSRYVILKHTPHIKFLFGVWPYLDVETPLKRT